MYLILTIPEQVTELSQSEAGVIIVGEVFTGLFIMTELSALGNIAHSTHIFNQIVLVSNTCHIVFSTPYWRLLALELS